MTRMGLLDKLRGEFVDIIEWIDDTRQTLVWRFPRYQNEIKNGAQLIVRPGQVAVFVSEGRLADVFQPGRHELTTQNLPILSTLKGWKHGFDSPFRSEVYFVATRQVTELKWGTPNPVMLRDHDFGPVRVRAFGTYALRALDPVTLLKELVGTDASFAADEIGELLRSTINTSFADLMGSSQIAVLDLAGNYQSLSDKLRQTVAARIDDEYGLEIPQLAIVNISLPEEVEKALDTRTSMGVVGDLNRYQQFQMGKAMTTAGGAAGEGLGLGIGVAMAGRMLQATPAAAPAPPPLPGEVQWHVAIGGQSQGPYTQAQLAAAILARQVTPQTLVWTAGMPAWVAASAVPTLASAFAAPQPPPQPPPAA
jgi:membrane protease subunit (stomatin/prohibitin family)